MNKVVAFVLGSFSTVVFSQTPAELVQAKLNAVHTLTANFSQVVKAKKKEVSSSSGKMALERPGRFRWETRDPMVQIIVADGTKMWVYDPDLEQVTVKAQDKGLGGTAAVFLSGYNESVTKDYDVTQKVEGDTYTFDMQPKSTKSNYQHIQLIFKQEVLTGLVIHDQLGQVTSVKLLKIKTNPKVEAKLFQFKPPKGVDVVKE